MLETLVLPAGPYRLRLMRRSGTWHGALVDGSVATAWQRPDGAVVVRASTEAGLESARFMLALADDTTEFHRRFRDDRLLGPTARMLVGYRPLRLATVAHAGLRAICGQLIEARKAAAIERSVLRRLGVAVATTAALRTLSPLDLHRHGLATSRAATLARLVRSIDLERLRAHDTDVVLQRLTRERGVGPWSVGVIALEGLGRYDHGLVGDLGLVKLLAALRGAVGRRRGDRGAARAIRGMARARGADADARLVTRPRPRSRSGCGQARTPAHEACCLEALH